MSSASCDSPMHAISAHSLFLLAERGFFGRAGGGGVLWPSGVLWPNGKFLIGWREEKKRGGFYEKCLFFSRALVFSIPLFLFYISLRLMCVFFSFLHFFSHFVVYCCCVCASTSRYVDGAAFFIHLSPPSVFRRKKKTNQHKCVSILQGPVPVLKRY